MICACCNDPAKTTYEECWLESMSGVPSGVVLIEGRSVYHAFKGEICADCLHDHARPDEEEIDVHVSRAQIRSARTMGSMRAWE